MKTGSPDILIKWPTRSRPDMFRATFEHWQSPAVRFLVSIDADDPLCMTDSFLNWLGSIPNLKYVIGRSKGKIDAINRDLDEAGKWDVCILAADDLVPQRSDYAEVIAGALFDTFPDGDGVVHVNDGRAGRVLNTMPVMGRRYFNRFGYIYYGGANHPDGYQSLWADNEFQEVSESLKRTVYIPETVVRHEWIGHYVPTDPLNVRNEAFYQSDMEIFLRRKAAGFPA